jgi:3-oxoacyl-[acyl-carrier protein] reductase
MAEMAHAFEAFDLHGRAAVVTGGATGLGFHITRALARSGATVLIGARRENLLREASEQLSTDPLVGKILYKPVDLGDRASIAAFADYARVELGKVDIYVGNAGQDMLQPIESITDQAIDQMMQVNLSANVELVRAFLPGMRERQWGRIIFISSALTVCSSPHEGAGMYTAVKGALNAFTRTAAAEVGHDGITVNSLIMGMYLTDIVRNIFKGMDATHGPGSGDAARNSITAMTALGRLGEAREVEGLIQLLASDAGGYITGTNLAIDGGMTIMLRPNPPRS